MSKRCRLRGTSITFTRTFQFWRGAAMLVSSFLVHISPVVGLACCIGMIWLTSTEEVPPARPERWASSLFRLSRHPSPAAL
jgi:hypothetical protein